MDQFYRRLNEAAVPEPATSALERVRVPDGITTLYLIDGSQLQVPENRIIEVTKEDAVAFGMRGWKRLAVV